MSRRRLAWAAAALIAVGAVVVGVVLLTGGRQAPHRPRPRAPVSRRPPVSPCPPAPSRPVPAPPPGRLIAPFGLTHPKFAPGPPALPAPATVSIGISVNRLFNDQTASGTQIAASLRALARTGGTDARTDALWEAAEPAPPVGGVHHYDWSFDDRIAGALAAHGLRWLPIIDYSAHWAQSLPGQDHSPPTCAAGYAAYAGAFAARYGSGGTFWRLHPRLPPRPVRALEIWNEPDGGHFWLAAADPNGYGNLYAAARAAAHAAEPGIRVLIGGLTSAPGFMPALLHARPDLSGHIDGVAIHSYPPNPQAVVGAVHAARATLRHLGLATVPLYVTEFGWTPRPPGTLGYAPARLRPLYIFAALSALAHTDCTVAGAFLYTWVTPERDAHVGDDWFGIHPPRGAGTSRAQRAFAAGVRTAHGARAPLRICGTV